MEPEVKYNDSKKEVEFEFKVPSDDFKEKLKGYVDLSKLRVAKFEFDKDNLKIRIMI